MDICTVAIKNNKNIHAVSTNQIADILHVSDKSLTFRVYFTYFCFQIQKNISTNLDTMIRC